MKIIQITDTHVAAHGQRVHELDPCERLVAGIRDINAHHGDAAMCIITGDLAHEGRTEAYLAFKDVLSELSLPWHLILGNHDHREEFREVFPDTPIDEHGFVESVIDTEVGRLILIDTVADGEKYGVFCEERAAWLRKRLDETNGAPAYLFMHHPPFATGIPSLDRIRLLDPSRLRAVVEAYSNIRHMFFGHVHRPIAGSWAGIPCSALRGTNHQVALDFKAAEKIPRSYEPPAYGVILIDADSVLIHFHDYMDKTGYFLP
jgi:3',5'-cyclic AMP phosphodiesterase CpdA